LGLLFSQVLMALIVLRTVLEDRLLRRGLSGYAEYTRTVKYRLIPHVW
jgi:protein-S-isoprenylcysteine O-methyltransferase Ste14